MPGRWREGDVVLLAGASPVALAGSGTRLASARSGAARPGSTWRPRPPRRVPLARGPRCSLVHDVSLGGLAVALAKAALHSGVGADVALPDDPRAWFGEGGGQAVLACAPDDVAGLGGVPIRRLGVVGGTGLLGVELDELREAWA